MQRLSSGLHQPLIGQKGGMRACVRTGGDRLRRASARFRRRRQGLPRTAGGEGPVGQEAGFQIRGGRALDAHQGRVPGVCDASVDAYQRAAVPVTQRNGRHGQGAPVERCDLSPGRAETAAPRDPAAGQGPHVGPLGRLGAQEGRDVPDPVRGMELGMDRTRGGQIRGDVLQGLLQASVEPRVPSAPEGSVPGDIGEA